MQGILVQGSRYCNLLSESGGDSVRTMVFCSNEKGEFAVGMKLAPDYLHRTGYRLPTEAEWSGVCVPRPNQISSIFRRYSGIDWKLCVVYCAIPKNDRYRSWDTLAKRFRTL